MQRLHGIFHLRTTNTGRINGIFYRTGIGGSFSSVYSDTICYSTLLYFFKKNVHIYLKGHARCDL